MSEADNTCVICFDTISILSNKNYNKPKKMMTLDCNHKFHINCIEEWVAKSNTCPICRSPIKKEEDNRELQYTNIQVQQNPPIQEHYINIGRQTKKHKIIIISLLLFILSILNFAYFYGISYKYIDNFKIYLSNNPQNCTTIENETVIDKDCPNLSIIDSTFIILGGIIYVILFMFEITNYVSNKKINITSLIIVNIVCGLFIALYYIINLLSKFNDINRYYTNNPFFNSSIERNVIISVIIFYNCLVFHVFTYIWIRIKNE